MIHTVFLLPGQGCYQPGAFAGQFDPELAEVLDTVDRVAAEFGRGPVSGLLRRPDAPSAVELGRTDSFALQLAIFAAGLGWYRLALRTRQPDVLVGHSMGEITALTAAGAFDPADGARLVCHRSLALLAGCPQPGGMVAVGLNARRAEALVGLLDQPGLALAVRNAPDQSVLSGPEGALRAVQSVAGSLQLTATVLSSPFPYHSPMLAAVGPAFGEAVAGIAQRPLGLRVYSPVAGRYLDDRVDLKALLADQLTSQVDFLSAVRELHADGAGTFVECGRAGLSGLIRRTVPEVTAANVEAAVGYGGYVAQGQQSVNGFPANGYGQIANGHAAVQPAYLSQPTPAQPDAPQQSFLAQPDAPLFGQPAAPQQSFAPQPVFGQQQGFAPQPVFGQPIAGQPAAGQPLQPAFGQGEPTYLQPAVGPAEPTYLQPAAIPVDYLRPATVPADLPPPAVAQPSPSQAPALSPAATPSRAAADSAEVLPELLALYASSLGYPAEAMSADADLEADLGIDSLKRAEMLGKVRAHFGLADSTDDGRFLAQSTLGELAELVAAAR